MREILFRGRRKTIGGWALGYLYENYENSEMLLIDDYEVIPETIGQFTGLTDKNGTKIFEGDIVKVTNDNGETNFCSCGIGYVLFYDGSWYIDEEVNDGLYEVSKIYYIEVIGNIHDNPELVKELGK